MIAMLKCYRMSRRFITKTDMHLNGPEGFYLPIKALQLDDLAILVE